MDYRSTVVAILERREYTGCTVNFKTYTNSIWDKKQRDNPIEKQAIFPNAHERIIDDDVFEKVQGDPLIRVKVLERLVLKHIQVVMGYILRHEDYFRTIMEEQLRVESCEQIRIRRKRLKATNAVLPS